MGRPIQPWYPGAIFHAIVRGNDGQPIFLDDDDRRGFLNRLEIVKTKLGSLLYAYCLMTNHAHLLIKACVKPISSLMHALLTPYVMGFNEKHGRRGHLFQDRFYRRLVGSERYLGTAFRYIHRNSVKAGMVARCEDYPHSSMRDYVGRPRGGLVDTADMLEFFGSREALIEFHGQPGSLEENEAMLDAFPCAIDPSDEEQLSGTVEDDSLALERVYEMNRAEFGVEIGELRRGSRRAAASRARRRFVAEAARLGFRQSEIARYLGCSIQAVSMSLTRGEAA